jgi:peptidoglycan/LPS O-acetylase OafA/YrhL
LSFESALVPFFPVAHILMIGILCLAMPGLMRQRRTLANTLAGNISYGIYLIHLVVIDILRAVPWHMHKTAFALLSLGVAAFLSLIFEFGIQTPADRLRKHLFYSARAD